MDGLYNRREIKIAIYESGEKCFLVVVNDQFPDEPIVVSDDREKKIIHYLMAEISK